MSEPTVSDRTDTPAVALGPTALVLGVISVLGSWVPALMMLPWAFIAGGLAVTLGAAGIHQARRGIGRLWVAVAGTVLGAMGFVGVIALFWAIGA